jgi:pyruvate/2-oxoglutarate dehydrogenase complex dihydrolipoamide acyltransferase (E2) component
MDVELPRLADTLTEGTLARWLKRSGDEVVEGEPIAELETDKINSELAAPVAGVLTDLLVGEGETVDVGTVLARITPAGTALPERTPVSAAAAGQAPDARAAAPDTRASRLRQHLRASRERVPAGMCAREIPGSAALERLTEVAAEAARTRTNLAIATLPASTSHLVMPALPTGRSALVQAGAERRGQRMLTLCFDRRVLDDWEADRLLAEIAAGL